MRDICRHVLAGTLALLAVLPACSSRDRDRMERQAREIVGDDDERRERDRGVDLNSASRDRLTRLPGLTDEDATRIVENRPYANERALVRKKVLTEDQFARIKDRVYVRETREQRERRERNEDD
jgi:DNA uptake protein ComE-like DNA-binding protein